MDEDERKALNAAMARLAAGDRSQIDPVYARLDGPIRRFCARMLGPGPDAEDAAQEALEELYGKVAQFDPTRDALAWAMTIATWECRTVRKRRSRARTAALDEASSPDQASDPAEDVLTREVESALAAAIGDLRAEDRVVLEQVLEETRGDATFRKRKQRMIERLRALVRRTYDLDA